MANEARLQWYQKRIEQIHNAVTAYDVLRHNGINLIQSNDDTEEQISCPFHGEDKKPSARIYPDNGDEDRSHVWCFVCQETRWDVIGLWRKFNGGPENCTLSEALSGIERTFGLATIDAPAGGFSDQSIEVPKKDEDKDRFKAKYIACERRLLSCRPAYKYLNDMQGYLAAGSALDKIRYKVSKQGWSAEKAINTLDQLLEKIREKVGRCPVG